LRDPTRPPANALGTAKPVAAKPASRNRLVLQTVVISEQRRTAVINGRVMSVGDTISGFTVAKIREAEVVMKGSKGTRTLRLYPAVNKIATTTLPEETKGHE
jgi:MSHA biogenesis protein MshK